MKNDIKQMKSLNFFVNKCSSEVYNKIKPALQAPKKIETPLLSWDLHQENHYKNLENLDKENDFKELKFYIDKYQWKNDLKTLVDSYKYDALVITDLDKRILWVSKGFTKMTGYPRKKAILNTPSFLQGELTEEKVKKRIVEKIQLKKPFKEVITNYKKDKSTYKCELYIIPLINDITTHFIALERAI